MSEERPEYAAALTTQVGGNHYKDMPIQPVEYIHKNGTMFTPAVQPRPCAETPGRAFSGRHPSPTSAIPQQRPPNRRH